MLRTMILFSVWLACCTAFAAPVSLPDQSRYPLDSAVQYLEDPKAALDIRQVRALDDWHPNGDSVFKKGYNSSDWWLHLAIRNDGDESVHRYLQLGYAVLDYIDVYVYDGDRQLDHHAMGDHYPYQQRPVDNRFFVVPLNWEAGQTLDIYLRIRTSTSVQAPLELWERTAFESQENLSNILHGFYYGAMVVIVVYNLLIFFVLWERSYLYYVGFVLSMPLFMAALHGHGFRFVWPEAVAWNEISIPVTLAASLMFGALFTRRFLTLGSWSVGLDRLLLTFVVLGGAMLFLSLFLPYSISIRILVLVGLFACLADMVAGVIAWRRGVPTARYYCIAWGSFLIGSVVLALNKLNLLPSNLITEYAVQIGSVLEAVLLSFAMAERINVERRLRSEAQEEALSVTRRLNEELEQRVHERTRELEKLNQRLEELSNTDQLTGLKNRRFLDKAMQDEWERCKRYRHPLSVLLLDIDFFKRVNDDYGHPAGDVCLKRVAERIEACGLRTTDKAARYGGEEFCLILPETDLEGALVVAERIRAMVAASPMKTEAGALSITVSLGVYTAIPEEDSEVESWIHCADVALYASKENGRNRVTPYQPEQMCNVTLFPGSRKA